MDITVIVDPPDLTTVEEYLVVNDWQQQPTPVGSATVWTLPPDGYEVICPSSRHSKDFERCLAELIRTVAIAENRSETAVLETIAASSRNQPQDSRWRVVTTNSSPIIRYRIVVTNHDQVTRSRWDDYPSDSRYVKPVVDRVIKSAARKENPDATGFVTVRHSNGPHRWWRLINADGEAAGAVRQVSFKAELERTDGTRNVVDAADLSDGRII